MKPSCPDRSTLALLAGGALDDASAREAGRHLEGCPACARYVREVSAVCHEQTRAAADLAEVELAVGIERRIAAAIRREPRRGPFARWAIGLAVPAVMVAVALLLGWAGIQFLNPAQRGEADPPAVQQARVPARGVPGQAEESLASTTRLSAYRQALNRSDSDFERLLAVGAKGGLRDESVRGNSSRTRLEQEM